jgi:pimeloyl-ACP methyl ester carboxylesterase
MMGELIRVFSDDGLELQGLFCPPRTMKKRPFAISHIHGLATNFYANRFIDAVADKLVSKGDAFLTFNNRGHDYISDFVKKKNDGGLTYVPIGSANEVFEECVLDIKATLDFLEKRNFHEIILEGHSEGAIKAVYYQSKTQDKRVKGIVLMSPPDIIGLQKSALGDKYEEAIKAAVKMTEEGRSDELMPKIFFVFPVSAKTYLDLFGPNTKIGVFSFHDTTNRFEDLAKITCPLLAFFGTQREAVVDNVETALDILKRKAVASTLCETALIQGAGHNYIGYENKVAELVSDWLERIR